MQGKSNRRSAPLALTSPDLSNTTETEGVEVPASWATPPMLSLHGGKHACGH